MWPLTSRSLIVIAIICTQACDAPWAGPSVPDGSRAVNLVLLNGQGPFDMVGPAILASTSVSELSDQVIARARAQLLSCASNQYRQDPCWKQQADVPGRVYVAVITANECNRAVKESTVLSQHTLYFIHWIGNPQGVCNAAMRQPNWRLFYVSRSSMPNSGTLTVRLQLQGDEQGNFDSQVDLS